MARRMAYPIASARYRLGHILGGDEGAGLVAEAEAWCASEGIVNPERATEILAPGFDPPLRQVTGHRSS